MALGACERLTLALQRGAIGTHDAHARCRARSGRLGSPAVACVVLEEARCLQGGDLVVGRDRSDEYPGGIGKPAVGGRLGSSLDGLTDAREVLVAHHRRDERLIDGCGNDRSALCRRVERLRSAIRLDQDADWYVDAVDGRDGILLMTWRRVVRVVSRQPDPAGTGQVAGEPISEVGYQRLPTDVTILGHAVEQNQRRPLAVHPSNDLGAIGRHRSVNPVISHDGRF